MNIPEIVSKCRNGKSLRKFADSLSVSHMTVKYWEDGTSKPSYYFMLIMAEHNNDWRRQFALDILAVLKPELYQPDGVDKKA